MDNLEFEKIWTGPRTELPAMLDARENRAFRQLDLLERYGKPLLCFTMNIAGPVKNNPLIRKGFAIGAEDFHLQLLRLKIPVIFEALLHEDTGNEGYFVLDADPYQIKELTCELEDRDELGRLYDMDILYPGDTPGAAKKIDRQEIGLAGRKCLLCGRPAKECSSRRIHTVPELQKKTASILYEHVLAREASLITEYAQRALLYEVSVTPKPGLVDRVNSGSHKDMDFYTFLNSAASLWPYLEDCVKIGQETAAAAAPDTFRQLRLPGRMAENRMLRATNGINTHKGAIFSMGIAAAAAGRLTVQELLSCDMNDAAGHNKKTLWREPAAILAECARMTDGLTAGDFAGITEENARTAGQKLYVQYGITGIRGQMEAGLPAVSEYGLPLLKKLLAEGKSCDAAGAAVLLAIIAHTDDTNMIHRSDLKTQKEAAVHAAALLAASENNCPKKEALSALDQEYIGKNLSPGGSADLLAICWFLYALESEHSLY